MENIIFAAMLLLPFIAGLYMFIRPLNVAKTRSIYVFVVSLIVSVLVYVCVFTGSDATICLLRLDDSFSLAFRMDSLTKVFALIVATLWPIAVLYSIEYMSHEENENNFFGFYTLTYGVVLGIAFAENFFTLYLFYELLTLATLPLVMHEMDDKARFAGKRYIGYSMSGAALCFIAMVLISQSGSLSFATGASFVSGTANYWQFVFLMAFLGFGVKAAVVPLHVWLPTAGVAPTPVTALLHAVAVVNSGVFAIMRLIYCCIGTELLSGSWAQNVAMAMCCITIVYGSAMALRNQNLKRRLAYSTVSNLSYILLGATAMCPAGLAAALMHMVVHSAVKITLFFCAGALLCATHHQLKTVDDYQGLGKKLPLLFSVFAVASLALIGIPPLAGFQSKWAIASAGLALGTPMGIVGAASLCVSAFLTGIYLIDVLVKAVFPLKNMGETAHISPPGWRINVSLVMLTGLILVLSIWSEQIYGMLALAAGLQ